MDRGWQKSNVDTLAFWIDTLLEDDYNSDVSLVYVKYKFNVMNTTKVVQLKLPSLENDIHVALFTVDLNAWHTDFDIRDYRL